MADEGLRVDATPVPGLLLLRLPVHRDERGWFKENWHHAAMVSAGLPDFGPVQHNVAHNARAGVTRGFHAEPWDKLVSVAAGRVHGAWLDLREGQGFGRVVEHALDAGTAVFVPRGVANAYQALEDGTAYSYLVNEHWRPGSVHPSVNAGDPAVGVRWPLPLTEEGLSAKDRAAPPLADVDPVPAWRVLVLGADGQLGRALRAEFGIARAAGRDQLDLADPAAVAAWPWEEYDAVLNAAAYTAVDLAETPDGRARAWAVNAAGPAALAGAARDHGLVLVHYSTDYVFDGRRPTPAGYRESDPPAPLGVYGQSKAAGELAVAGAPRHYLVRTSWVVGEGHNFVRTMAGLADGGACPEVVDDQIGRLTFAGELARGTRHLLETGAPYGTYHLTCEGEPMSWYDVAREVFALRGRSAGDVRPVGTAAYAAGRDAAPRPTYGVLDLSKIEATGFDPADARAALADYLRDG